MFPERGSMSRTFLSLQVVAKRLPSVLKDMERTTSVWWLIVRMGFFITCSGQSRFQIITWTWKLYTLVNTHTHIHKFSNQPPIKRELNSRNWPLFVFCGLAWTFTFKLIAGFIKLKIKQSTKKSKLFCLF